MVVVTRANPLLVVFMLDQSASMNDKFGNASFSKATALANAVNRTLYEIALKSVSGGEVVSRFEIGMFAYSGEMVCSGWEGKLKNKFVHTIRNIFENPITIRNDDTLEWITPRGEGGTPMYDALKNVKDFIGDWIDWGDHRKVCHPPIIINVTDGEATDDKEPFSGLRKVASDIMSLSTDFGSTIMLNIHISSENYDKVLFPSRAVGDNAYQKLLFEISSPLYKKIVNKARDAGYNLNDDAKGYVYNGDCHDLLHFLDIGTRGAIDR